MIQLVIGLLVVVAIEWALATLRGRWRFSILDLLVVMLGLSLVLAAIMISFRGP